jgi:hypothetical protein
MQVILRDGALIGPNSVSLLHSDLSIDCPWLYFYQAEENWLHGKQKTENRKQEAKERARRMAALGTR